MNRIISTLIATALFSIPSWADAFQSVPGIVPSEVDNGYVPDGFDTNDHVQVVVEGTFRNTCYKPATPKIEIDRDAKTILVEPAAYHYDGYCLQMMVPFNQVVEVGILPSGKFQVLRKSDLGSLGSLEVRTATNSGPDDYLYASVSQAYFEKVDGYHQLKISGELTNSCQELVEVRVDVQPKVIVVQPITEMADRDNCAQGIFPFEHVTVLENMNKGRYLLHVRSLNAKAINNLVDAI